MPDNAKPEPANPTGNEDLKKAEAALRVEQDSRVAQVKAEAEDAETREKAKKGANPDG